MENTIQNEFRELLGTALGGYVGHQLAPTENVKPLTTVIGLLVGNYLTKQLFGEPKDTVNYTLIYKGRRVYEGICYHDRKQMRRIEHLVSGKKFSSVKFDSPKERTRALNIERMRIRKYKPIYNVQHNCD